MKRTKAMLVTPHVQQCLDAHTFCSKRCSISTQISSEAKMSLTEIKIKITCNWNENQSKFASTCIWISEPSHKSKNKRKVPHEY